MCATARADVRIARAPSNAKGAVNRAQGAGQHRAADAALRREMRTLMNVHGVEVTYAGNTVNAIASGSNYGNNAATFRRVFTVSDHYHDENEQKKE